MLCLSNSNLALYVVLLLRVYMLSWEQLLVIFYDQLLLIRNFNFSGPKTRKKIANRLKISQKFYILVEFPKNQFGMI